MFLTIKFLTKLTQITRENFVQQSNILQAQLQLPIVKGLILLTLVTTLLA